MTLDLMQLQGVWRFERTVSSAGTMAGTATFDLRSDGRLSYFEVGALSLEGSAPLQFSRRYLYEPHRSGLRIWFDEPRLRLFQDVALIEEADVVRGHGEHLCAPDTYRSSYAFSMPHGFSIVHAVEGPRKSFTITTTYRRGLP